ncbi:MAG: hypothetical protein AAF291_17220 [Pseudomonadota bacterium]
MSEFSFNKYHATDRQFLRYLPADETVRRVNDRGFATDDHGDADSQFDPIDLHEAVAFWSDGYEEEEPVEKDQLASFAKAFARREGKSAETYGGYAANPTGRRAAARLRVSVPARFVAIQGPRQAILLNISRSGAMMALLDAVNIGEGGVLECGPLKAFGVVTRRETSVNAIRFEEPLTQSDVLAMRHYHEQFDERERRQLIETARRWANGEGSDDRGF